MDNFTINYTETIENYTTDPVVDHFTYPPTFRYVCYTLYNLVFITALLGNLLAFYTIHYTHPKLKTVQNYFLANLALCDLLIVILCVPTGYISVLWQYWPFGTIACHVITPIKAVGVFASSYTLVALAVDRYLAILYPLRMGLTRRECKWTIGVVWVGAGVTAGPVAWNTRVEVYEGSGEERCGEYGWESLDEELAYSLILLILQYIFPVCVLIYTYSRICYVVWGKGRSRGVVEEQRSWVGRGGGSRLSQGSSLTSRGKRKTIILSLSVVTCYTLAWLPYNVIYMIYKHGPVEIMDADAFPYVFLTFHWLAMSHSMFNPVIYFWINDRFRGVVLGVVVGRWPGVGRVLGVNGGRGGDYGSVVGAQGRGTRLESLGSSAGGRRSGV